MLENKIVDETDFELEHLEDKLNKLINIKVEPHVDCIINQYFLTELGGDHFTNGIIKEIDMCNNKLTDNLEIKNRKMLQNKIKSESIKLYEKYIDLSKTEFYSVKFEIYNHHLDQIKTHTILNKNTDFTEHISKLKKNKKTIETNLNLEKDLFFQKLLESQIGVMEQQLDLFR